jgi:hypothetical protein
VSEPLKARPMGVRTASTITASGIEIDSLRVREDELETLVFLNFTWL